MLEELSIQNFALIDRLTIHFTPGMNVLTGETGAGKSILVGALSLLRGVKADTESIRTGADEAVVSGVFRIVRESEAASWLDARGIVPEDDTVVVRRVIKSAGRAPIYLQSTPITRAELAELGALLFDIHGQHDAQSLFSEENHRRMLDRYAGLEQEVNEFTQQFQEAVTLRRRYEKLLSSERERLREQDLAAHAVQEIEEANLTAGEEEELEKERQVLSQHERLYGLLEQFYDLMSQGSGGALSQLGQARSALQQAAAIDEDLTSLSTRTDDGFYELEDVANEIGEYLRSMTFSPERLEEVEDRLALIHRLEKKYGDTVGDVLSHLEEARRQLHDLENWEEDKARLEQEIAERDRALLERAKAISERRLEAARELEQRVERTLKELGMPKLTFKIARSRREKDDGTPSCGPYGIDRIAFRFSPNPGEPLKPLRQIASGGEISRVMLALKTAFSDVDDVETMVFDEIDAGIGGEVAVAVGDHLAGLSHHKQVLCVTHLATIGVRADNHMRVEKRSRGERTITEVHEVSGEERVAEVARMLAGDTEGSVSRTHAQEILNRYAPRESR